MAKKTIKAQMKQRRDTKANWAATNPVLLDGELGIVSDDPNLYKVGDGATAWNSLPFRGFDGTLAQELGTSPNAVISQKVVTDSLAAFESRGKAFDNEFANKVLPVFYVEGEAVPNIDWDKVVLRYIFNGYADSVKLQFHDTGNSTNYDSPNLTSTRSGYYRLPMTIQRQPVLVSFIIDWSFIAEGNYYDAHDAKFTSYAFIDGYFVINANRIEDKSITKNKLSDEAVDVHIKETLEDFSIADEEGNCILAVSSGLPVTKNFNGGKTPKEDESLVDFDIKDKDGNVIFAIYKGIPITKNFDGRKILKQIEEPVETWSKLPLLKDNPLLKVRYDGGMARIFQNWGFIGDSLNSGEMYGYQTDELNQAETQDAAISNGSLISDITSIITVEKLISGYQPMLRMKFKSNEGLNGKILCADSTSYEAKITGSESLAYTISVPSGTSVLFSYPKNNKPQIMLQFTYVKDMYELSWGQQMARLLGASGYNFSVGGEYCKRWCIGEDNSRRWAKAQKDLKDVYTIALGVNDRGYWMAGRTDVVDYPCVTAYPNPAQYGRIELTEKQVLNDVSLENYENNANSYAGWYAGIIQRLKSVRKDAHIFCITNPATGQSNSEWNQVIRILVKALNEHYGNNTIWLVDLARYNTNNVDMNKYFDLNGHLSAFGYLYFAYQISTYIDWIIRNNILDFKGSSLIGTGASAHSFEII